MTLGDLRRNVSLLFRQHAHITDPKVGLLADPCACAVMLKIILGEYHECCSVRIPCIWRSCIQSIQYHEVLICTYMSPLHRWWISSSTKAGKSLRCVAPDASRRSVCKFITCWETSLLLCIMSPSAVASKGHAERARCWMGDSARLYVGGMVSAHCSQGSLRTAARQYSSITS